MCDSPGTCASRAWERVASRVRGDERVGPKHRPSENEVMRHSENRLYVVLNGERVG